MKRKKELLKSYFTREGMNYRLVRLHMDSCDFSLDPYEAMSDPSDSALDSFSFVRTKYANQELKKGVEKQRKRAENESMWQTNLIKL